jgi:hypothetical protein
MATVDTSLCIYLKKTPDPNPEIVRGLIEQGADPFCVVGVKPNGMQYNTMTMVAEHPNAVALFRILAGIINLHGKLEEEMFFFLPNFLSVVTQIDNRELFLLVLPYLSGGETLFRLPVHPWYWNEFFKVNSPEILQDLTYETSSQYDALGYALHKGAPMEILRFIAKHLRIHPLKTFQDGYGYLELACCYSSVEVVEWLVKEHGCLCYAHDVHGQPLSPMGEIHEDHFDMIQSMNYAVLQMGMHMLQQIVGIACRPFPLLVAMNCYDTTTLFSKLTFLLQHGALHDINRRLAFDDLYDLWYGIPNSLKMAIVISDNKVRHAATLHLLKNGAVPTQDVVQSPRGRFIPELVQQAIHEYLWLGYFFLVHGADDTKSKRQKPLGPKLPNVLYTKIGSFLLCARQSEYECFSRCLPLLAYSPF